MTVLQIRFLVSRCSFLEKPETENQKRFLPGRFRNSGDLTLERQSAEAQAADAELAQKAARPSADRAAVVLAG
jgi:hypothetical protein